MTPEEEEFEFRYRYEQEQAMMQTMQQAEPSMGEQAAGIAKQAISAANPVEQTKNFFQTDPATMQRVAGPILPVMGGMAAGPVGAAAGEFARQVTGTAFAPDTVPQTPLGRAASVMTAGIAQEPKILGAIPGATKVGQMVSALGSKVGKGLAKGAQAISGGKAGDLIEGAKKGLLTYGAPSMEKAGAQYGKALEKLPGEKIAATMVEHIEAAITPEGSAGSKFLKEMGKKLDRGELIDARQALKAKQALDDVIDTVPVWQIKRRGKLFDLKRTFDEVLTSQSGQMKEASNTYRAAILKDNLTKPLPVNKHGEYSRLAPMLATLAGGVGGVHSGSTEKGAMGGLGYLLATSPLAMGLGATAGGSAARGLMKLGENPATRQALLQILQKLMRKEAP